MESQLHLHKLSYLSGNYSLPQGVQEDSVEGFLVVFTIRIQSFRFSPTVILLQN